MINVLFFAQLREQLGCERVSLAPEPGMTLADLRRQLLADRPQWRGPLADQRLLMAVNHTLVKVDHPVADGDEVAFFPPVTGG